MKSHSRRKAEAGCFVGHQNQRAEESSNQGESLQSFLLGSSADPQAQEALQRSRRLEQELWRAKEAVAALEGWKQSLKREQVETRRRVEEARQALVGSISKVKELEAKASQVPGLQRHILHLESEIRFCR